MKIFKNKKKILIPINKIKLMNKIQIKINNKKLFII